MLGGDVVLVTGMDTTTYIGRGGWMDGWMDERSHVHSVTTIYVTGNVFTG